MPELAEVLSCPTSVIEVSWINPTGTQGQGAIRILRPDSRPALEIPNFLSY